MSDNYDSEFPAASSTRDKVLDAALAVFGEKGFDGATTKEIALRAGINEVTLFRLFKNKGELFRSVLSSRFPVAQMTGQFHFDRSLPPGQVLETNAMVLLRIMHAHRNLFLVMFSDLPRRSDPAGTANNFLTSVIIGPFGGYLASQMEAGKLRKMDPEIAAGAFFGMIQSYFMFNNVLARRDADAREDQRHVRGFVSIFLDGIARK